METFTVKGATFNSNLTDDQAAEICGKLDSSFGRDLARQHSRKPLSVLQRAWLHKLAVDSLPQEVTPVAHLPKIRQLIDKAVERGIKRPILRCVNAKIGLRRNGNLYVADSRNGSAYISIDKQGNLLQMPEADIYVELVMLNENPAEYASLYGHRTGCCCFCGRALETAESVTAGYGPICADKYGLPWGEKDSAVSTTAIVNEVAGV